MEIVRQGFWHCHAEAGDWLSRPGLMIIPAMVLEQTRHGPLERTSHPVNGFTDAIKQ
jgi:hypothetical protein